ncbi:hypothetical protein J1605_000795 [Eschrichtius robustus]|uniref:Protein SFI1 homolog n=1 Tax=Eschrichtius robustus TaxID=9764 RepID=A0AB34GJT7_ESCRO|nr:hypothetical protein J1605_000795 [Eschrichtius robustus]
MECPIGNGPHPAPLCGPSTGPGTLWCPAGMGPGSFFKGVQQPALWHSLRGWPLRAWDPGSARTTLAPAVLSGVLGGEALPGRRTPRSSLEKARGRGTPHLLPQASQAPALLEAFRVSFLWAAGQRQQARAQQSRGVARWHQRTLQRRILLGWSHWATAQGARRELAARRAWDQSCRAALGLWRQWLVQQQETKQWAREWGRRQQRRALGHWHCCGRVSRGLGRGTRGQQLRCEKYQRCVRARLQGLCRAVFRGWQEAAARQRPTAAGPEQLLLQSHFQAWCGVVRDTGMARAKGPAFQDGLRRWAPGATFASEAPEAAARPREQHVARASFSCWRSQEQGHQVDIKLRRAQAQQARQVAPSQCSEARQQAGERTQGQALCWMLWAQACAHSATGGRVQRTAITQFQQAGPRRLLRIHWAKLQTTLLRVWLEPQAEAQEASTAHPRPRASLRHWPRLATRGHLLVLMSAPALGRQVRPGPGPVGGPKGPQGHWPQSQLDSAPMARSCRPQATGPGLPSPTKHHSPSGQKKQRETSRTQTQAFAGGVGRGGGSRDTGSTPFLVNSLPRAQLPEVPGGELTPLNDVLTSSDAPLPGDREPPLPAGSPASQPQLQGPRCACWAQGQRPMGPEGDHSSETKDLKGKGEAKKRGRDALGCQDTHQGLPSGGSTCSTGALRHCFAGSGVPRRPGLGSRMAALGRCSGDGQAGADTVQAFGPTKPESSGTAAGTCIVNTPQMTPRHIPVLPVPQSCRQGEAAEGLGAAGPGTVVGPARGLSQPSPQLRQWHLRRAWRLWALRLQVSQRLQQQDGGWVHSQVLGANPFFFRGEVSSVRENSLDSRALRSAGDHVLSTVLPCHWSGDRARPVAQLLLTRACVGFGLLSAPPWYALRAQLP